MKTKAKITTVVHIRNANDAAYIGRTKNTANHFGNPFSHLNLNHTIKTATRTDCITAFQEWLEGNPKWSHVEPDRRAWILANMHQLKGRKLGCFCAPKACHGDVYAAMLDGND